MYHLYIKRMEFVHNTGACLKNRQVSSYQPHVFELNAFCLGTPVAFPQHVLLDVNKQIAQIAQRLSKYQCDCHSSKSQLSKTC